MTRRQKMFQDMLYAARAQTTAWLVACAAEPSEGMMRNPIVRLALRTVLRERQPTMPVDVGYITEYGATSKLSRGVRVY